MKSESDTWDEIERLLLEVSAQERPVSPSLLAKQERLLKQLGDDAPEPLRSILVATIKRGREKGLA